MAECENCLTNNVPIAAYEQAIEASHLFNLLQARGVISVAGAPSLYRPRPRSREGQLRGVYRTI
jgi:glycyl-tRNA synthetase alpha subunit